jgi:hypothetical protein
VLPAGLTFVVIQSFDAAGAGEVTGGVQVPLSPGFGSTDIDPGDAKVRFGHEYLGLGGKNLGLGAKYLALGGKYRGFGGKYLGARS